MGNSNCRRWGFLIDVTHCVVDDLKQASITLRGAASVNGKWARHHHIYGLIHGVNEKYEKARFELNMAAKYEPFEDARRRIGQARELCDQKISAMV
ncbi:MAG: hypothetical protein H0U74_18735 [Bradymonadaceae bacterium]|nr:hypothetical protein [Lujinxingiaceae bacterium]